MAMLGLCIVAGWAGIHFEDVRITFTMFIGGLVTWGLYAAPSAIKGFSVKDLIISRQKSVEASKLKKENAAKGLPPPDQTASLIAARRTIFPKDHNGKAVSKEQIQALLDAANWAPTHNLTEPWRFVVLQGESKKKFEELTIELVGKYTEKDKAEEAVERIRGKASKAWPLVSAYIVICMARAPGKGGKANPEWEDIASVAMAVQNMYLLATAQGLAPYWSSWQAVARDAPEMATFLGLDAARGDRCLGVFNLGHSDRRDAYRGSRKPIADKVTWME